MGGSGEKSPRMDLGKKMQLTNFVTISFVLGNTTYWGLETAVCPILRNRFQIFLQFIQRYLGAHFSHRTIYAQKIKITHW